MNHAITTVNLKAHQKQEFLNKSMKYAHSTNVEANTHPPAHPLNTYTHTYMQTQIQSAFIISASAWNS